MKLKIFPLVLLSFLMISLVVAYDESIVKIPFKVRWERQSSTEGILFIEPSERDTAIEGGSYAKIIIYNTTTTCINETNCSSEEIGLNDNFEDKLTLITTRLFGNYTEVQYNLEQFTKQTNFTKKWEDCIKLNGDLDYIIKTQMINKSEHIAILQNMTKDLDRKDSIIKDKQNQIDELKEEVEKYKKYKNWGWGVAVVLGLAVLYFLKTYYGWFRKKQHDEEEIPRDIPA